MDIPLRLICLMLLAWVPCAQKTGREDPGLFSRIRLLLKDNSAQENAQLEEFLKSLTPAQMLSAARQACAEAESAEGEFSDAMRAGSATMSVGLCLHFYLDGFDDPAEGVKTVLGVVADAEEPWLLRQAIVDLLQSGPDDEFTDGLETYANAHVPEIDKLLSGILQDRQENAMLRAQAMDALLSVAGISAVCAKDANVIAMRERTHRVLSPGELVRSGELTLTDQTLSDLKPIEERIRANVKLLERILADPENEPELVRQAARRVLKAYRRSVLISLDDEIDKALQHTQR